MYLILNPFNFGQEPNNLLVTAAKVQPWETVTDIITSHYCKPHPNIPTKYVAVNRQYIGLTTISFI